MEPSFFSKLLFFSLLSCTLLIGCGKTETQKPFVNPTEFILPNNMISPTLLKILEMTQVEHDGTLESIVQATQQSWLRKPGVERWQMDKKYEILDTTLKPLFEELGLLDEIRPTQKEYHDVIIFGATLSTTRSRLQYTLDLWQEGIKFKRLIFFVSDRPLDPQKESREELFDRSNRHLQIKDSWQEALEVPTTEADMNKLVWDQTELPDGFLDKVAVHFISAPMQTTPDGKTRRANTGDTVKFWLTKMDLPGPILAISNQPYVGYQHAVLKAFLPETVKFETVGNKKVSFESDTQLDNLARWLYQENIYRKQKTA